MAEKSREPDQGGIEHHDTNPVAESADFKLIDQFAGRCDDSVYPPGYLEEVRRGWQ